MSDGAPIVSYSASGGVVGDVLCVGLGVVETAHRSNWTVEGGGVGDGIP